MSPLSITDRSLGSRYWITDDLNQFDALCEKVSLVSDCTARVESVETPPDDLSVIGKTLSNDATITSLAKTGGGNPLKSTQGQLKLLASVYKEERTDLNILRNGSYVVLDVLSGGGLQFDFDRLVRATARMNRFFLTGKDRDDVTVTKDGQRLPAEISQEELDTAETALRELLISGEFKDRALSKDPLDHEGLKALVNAALGVMKACREQKVSAEALLAVSEGTNYDLAKGADVLRLAVKSAQQARAKFVDEANLRALLSRPEVKRLDAESFSRIEKLIDAIIDERKRVSASLDLKYDIADALKAKTTSGRKSAIDDKVRDVCNALRSFRYEMDGFTGRLSQAGLMERLRRSFDDTYGRLWRAKTPHISSSLYKELVNSESNLAKLLARVPPLGGNPSDRLKFTSSDTTSEQASALTHEANNAVRYYFSGREQKLDSFALKVHKLFDPLVEKGGSSEVTLEEGMDVRLGIDTKVANLNVKAGVKHLNRVKISVAPGGGEVTVTELNGGGVEGKVEASVKAGVTGKDVTVGAEGGAEIGGGKRVTLTFRSLDDFIRHANGSSDLTRTSALSTLCLGRIFGFFRAIGRGARTVATKIGLRIHRSTLDMHELRTQFAKNGVVGNLDAILSATRTDHSVRTLEKTGGEIYGSAHVSGEVSFGPELGKDNKLLDTGAKLSGGFNAEFRVTAQKFRSFVDSMKLQSDDWLDAEIGRLAEKNHTLYAAFAAATSAQERLAVIADALRRVELRTAKPDDTRAWQGIAATYRDLALLLAKVRREKLEPVEAEIVDAEIEPRIRSPRAEIPEEIFRTTLIDRTGAHNRGKTSYDGSFKITYDLNAKSLAQASGTAVDPKGISNVQSWEGLGRSTLKNLTSSSVSGVLAQGGLSGAVGGSLHYEPAQNPNGALPWQRKSVTTVNVELNRNLPIDVFVNQVASLYVDANTDIPPETKKEVARQIADDLAAAFLCSFVGGVVVGEYAKFTVGKALAALEAKGSNPAAEFFGAPFLQALGIKPKSSLEVDMDVAAEKVVQFQFSNGRLQLVSIANRDTMGGTIGGRTEVAPGIGIGWHVSEKHVDTKILRSALQTPDLTAFLGTLSGVVAGGNAEQVKAFFAHNKTGVDRLERLLTLAENGSVPPTDDPHPTDGENARKMLDDLEAELGKTLDDADITDLRLRDQLHTVREELRASRGKPGKMDVLLLAALRGYQTLDMVRSARDGKLLFSQEAENAERPDLFVEDAPVVREPPPLVPDQPEDIRDQYLNGPVIFN